MREYLNTLVAMHSYCRPHGTPAEIAFIARFVEPLGAERDLFGNWHLSIGTSPILWSCHTDTVHRASGRQTVHFDTSTGLLKLSKRSKQTSACLGADDTAGVFLCCELIKRGVPGHYVFHYGEESGGLGSGDLVREWPELVSGSQCAIALDRAGYGDVITHQIRGRTASDSFAVSLSAQLNTRGFKYSPCSGGIYTDTAEYIGVIPECSNLSVGYFRAHTRDECLDVWHLLHLLERLSQLDQSALVIARDPSVVEDDPYTLDWPDDPRCRRCDAWLFDADCGVCWKCGYADDHTMAPITSELGSDAHVEDWRDCYLSSEYGDVQAALRDYMRNGKD